MSLKPHHHHHRPLIIDSIQEINSTSSTSWPIGNRILLSRQQHSPPPPPSDSTCYWSDGTTGSFYVLSQAPYPLPPPTSATTTTTMATTTHIKLIHDVANQSAVWSIGEAVVLKIKILDPGATREHVTLDYLHNNKGKKLFHDLGFAIPVVHYHAEFDDGRYYIVLSRLPGRTLTEAWPDMTELTKQHYATQIATICEELAKALPQADTISGVDGQNLSDHFLAQSGEPEQCSPLNLLNRSKGLGMDCSGSSGGFVFYHCDLGPTNIIVMDPAEEEGGSISIGIIDWETAGFVPREWIRTKFRISGGLDLPGDTHESRVDWRKRVQLQLGRNGFPEVSSRFLVK